MEYWYLWLLLIVLCGITVFVLSKASAAAKKHNNERDALLREYDRKKALKDEFSFLTREKRRVPTRKPYSRVFRRSCRQKRKKPKTLKRYSANLQKRKNTFTLYTIFRGYRERFPLVLFQKQR